MSNTPTPPHYVEGDFRKFIAENLHDIPKSFGHFEQLEFLGQGGMASVYKAYDPIVGRYVALKFLKLESPGIGVRLIAEARAQARIQHEHVCKVYEAGEIEGKTYIAMQYIPGKTLHDLIPELNLAEKIQVMIKVAEAMHAAHRTGLIHRDLKTSNVMLDHKEEEGWVPYVMDFGLAREFGLPGITRTGTVVGSPLYMSPEQARGEVKSLDRRSDVYSLGVMLYELLTGKLPLEGDTDVTVLLHLFNEEIIPVGSRDPRIPEDLQTIVMKCLEPDPVRRYESARAFAEDLQRYLDGDAIHARRATVFYRIWRKARKQKTLSLLSALAILSALFFSGIALEARWTAARQAALAQEFGREIEQVDGFMRMAYMLPLHNTHSEERWVRERIKRIDAQMHELGSIGFGPGNYAIARGYISLHEYELARKYLEKAWSAGYQQPEVACSLGEVLGQLYRTELDEAGRSNNPQTRRVARLQAEKKYLKPAMEYLRIGARAEIARSVYIEGLIAFFLKRYEEALDKAAASYRRLPWLYDAKKLEGDVFLAMGDLRRDVGDQEGAIAFYERSGGAYNEALKVARSDVRLYVSDCTRRDRIMGVQIQRGMDPAEMIANTLQPCKNAIDANPEMKGEIYGIESGIYLQAAGFQRSHDQDQTDMLKKAVETARLAVELDSDNAYSFLMNAHALRRTAETLSDKEEDPRSLLLSSTASYERAIQLNPGETDAHNGLAIASSILMEYEMKIGANPEKSFQNAVQGYESTIALDPDYAYPYQNLGVIYQIWAEYEIKMGKDPLKSIEKSLKFYRKAIKKNSGIATFYGGISDTFLILGEYQKSKSIDYSDSLKQAAFYLEAALKIDPGKSDLQETSARLKRLKTAS